MDESPPVAPTAPSLGYMSATPAFRGRRAGLIGWGVVLILLGAFASLLAIMVPVVVVMSRRIPSMEPPQLDIPGLIIAELWYIFVAASLIWTGIASIRVRRWARPITVILGWTWLIMGLIVLASMLAVMGDIASGSPAVAFFTIGIWALVMIFLPTALLLFYARSDVRETFDYFDPGPAWTDRCPTSVLGLSLGMWIMAFSTLTSLPYSVTPFFGIYLSGFAGAAVLIITAALSAFAGWKSYQLRWSGWWVSLAILALLPVSALITSLRLGPTAMLEALGNSPEEIEMIAEQAQRQQIGMDILMAVFVVAGIGYMLWIRRHFRTTPA